jgi:hypothetical protein
MNNTINVGRCLLLALLVTAFNDMVAYRFIRDDRSKDQLLRNYEYLTLEDFHPALV